MGRTVVLLSANYDRKNEWRNYVESSYTDSVRLAGGIPVIVPFQLRDEDIDEVLRRGDALIMTGGADVDPAEYGEGLHAKTVLKYEKAQQFDLEMVRRARGMGMPVLGICLGAQQINVACGGTLYQDVAEQMRTTLRHHRLDGEVGRPRHKARIEKGTLLHEIVGEEEMVINSSHHQAIKEVGKGLRISARSTEDEIIEAVEDSEGRWFLGVQWHPEAMAERGSAHLRLFEALVERAGHKS
jgi:putative glutamine amidotransferase